METALVYLLKMCICSGVLYGYYRLALYNERFHQWNRFYLLAAMALSVVVPFVNIQVVANAGDNELLNVLASMPWNVNAGVAVSHTITWQDVALGSAALVSIVLFVRVIAGITKIVVAYRSHPVSRLQHDVQLIITSLTQAPFSFFNWLFWRHDIDPASPNGKRMLDHELTHIREHHSIDKLFTSLLLCVFWMNPFFWFMRRELSTIHEFLADRKAIGPQDGAAFAEMILQALPLTPAANNGLVNPFFSSQIKRRLLMITTSKNVKYSYLRRLSGLAIMISSVFALALSIQHAEAQKPQNTIVIKKITSNQTGDSTAKKKTTKMTFSSPAEGIYLTADTIFLVDKADGKTSITTKGKGTVQMPGESKSKVTFRMETDDASLLNGKNQPLILLGGTEITNAEMQALDPNTIKAVVVLKNENAAQKHGEKAKNGVIEITLKSQEELDSPAESIVIRNNGNAAPLYYVDGNAISNDDMKKIQPNDIESVNVLKGDNAIKKYGEKAKNGVVEITIKKPVT